MKISKMKIFNKVYEENDKIRIDNYLKQHLNITRSFISKLIKDNLVYVNESLITKPGYLIKQNDLITVHEKQENINETNNNLQIRFEIIYEDEYLMVINKPKN